MDTPIPPAEAALIQAIVTGVRDLQLVRSMQIGATALIYFDYFLTFRQEVNLFWRHSHPWSLPRLLFFANRYFAIIALTINTAAETSTLVSDKFCSAFIQIITVTGVIELLLVQLVLIVRIDGMYGKRKIVTYPLLALCACSIISAGIVSHFSLKNVTGTAHPLPGFSLVACSPVGQTINVWAFWVPVLIFEVTAFSLALGRTLNHLMTSSLPGSFGSRVMWTILRDSLTYFAVILSMYLINAFLWRFAANALLEVVHGFTQALGSVLCSRMLINLREEGQRQQKGGSTMSTEFELAPWQAQSNTMASMDHTYSGKTLTSTTDTSQYKGGKISFASRREVNE